MVDLGRGGETADQLVLLFAANAGLRSCRWLLVQGAAGNSVDNGGNWAGAHLEYLAAGGPDETGALCPAAGNVPAASRPTDGLDLEAYLGGGYAGWRRPVAAGKRLLLAW